MVHLRIKQVEKEIPNLAIIIFRFHMKLWGCTLLETNIAPEQMVSQKESNFPTINFQGLCYPRHPNTQ